jgi:mRNA interferase HigB
VRIIKFETLEGYWEIYRDAERPLQDWYRITDEAKWTGPDDVRKDFASASFVGPVHAVFNIKGNRFRLIVGIKYRFFSVYVRWFGTHAEYSKIDDITEL